MPKHTLRPDEEDAARVLASWPDVAPPPGRRTLASAIYKATGMPCSQAKAGNLLSRLVRDGMIERVGESSGTAPQRYALTEQGMRWLDPMPADEIAALQETARRVVRGAG